MKHKRLVMVLCVVAAVAAFAACGSDDDGGSGGSAASTSTATTSVKEVKFSSTAEDGLPVGYPEPKAKKDLTIGFAIPLAASEPLSVLAKSMQATAKQLGGKVVVLDSRFETDRQLSNIEQFVAQKVDGIIVFPLDPRAILPGVEKAKKAGIPVIAIEYDNDNPRNVEPYDSQIVQGTDRLAYLEAQAAARKLGPGAKVGQIGLNAQAPTIVSIMQRTEKWAKAFGLDYQGIALNQTDDISGGEAAMTQLLSKHPDVQGVLAYNDASAIGAAAAARAAGKRDLVFFGNYGGASDGLGAIENGRIDGTVVFDQLGVGKYAVWGIYDLVEGVKLPKAVLPGPPVTVTAENVSEFASK